MPSPLDYAKPPPRRKLKLWIPIFAAVMLACVIRMWIPEPAPTPRPFLAVTNPTTRRIINPAVACRVLAMDVDSAEQSSGSGFFVSADGLLVTAGHVVKGKKPLGVVLSDGRQLTCSNVLADDEAHDLALLRVDGAGFPFVPLGYRSPAVGDMLWTTTQHGAHIASIEESYTDEKVGRCIGFAADLGPGDSGGALLNNAGVLVGVVIGAVDDDPKQCGAVPVAAVRKLLDGAHF